MIDPTILTNFNRTDNELEECLLFGICAAGKNGITASICLERLLKNLGNSNPFNLIRNCVDLASKMKEAGIGCYNLKASSFKELAFSNINLRTCMTDDLEKIKGIGPKTSRLFLLHNRPNMRVACLDRHILRWINDQGHKVPLNTPIGKKYKEIEKLFIFLAKDEDLAELDLKIWNKYRSAR